MTQNPYAGSAFDQDTISEPPRTSLMAVLSLVFSLIGCCVPIGLLGSLFGIFALTGISRSDGRVTGRGLAWAGIIIGIIFTVLWAAGVYGAIAAYDKFYAGITEPVMADIEAGDYAAAKSMLVSTISEEQIAQFRSRYQQGIGSFRGVPGNWLEWWQSIAANKDLAQNMNQGGTQNVIPMPGHFDQGDALMTFRIDQAATKSSGNPTFDEISIMLPDGTTINISDPVAAPSSTPPPTSP